MGVLGDPADTLDAAVIGRQTSLSTFGSRTRANLASTIIIVALVPLAVMAGLPFIWIYISSFKTDMEIFSPTLVWFPSTFYYDGYIYVWEQTALLRGYANSIIVSGVSVTLSVFTSVLAGYLFAKKDFWGKTPLFIFVLSTLMVPFFAIFIPSFVVYSKFLNLKDTYLALILPHMFTAFGILITRQFLHSIPNELIDSATVDGAGDWRVLWHIILPLSRSILAAIAIIQFLGVFNEFLWPLVMTDREDLYTLPVVLRRVYGQGSAMAGSNRILAAGVVAVTPIVIFFLIFQRQIVKGISLTGMKA